MATAHVWPFGTVGTGRHYDSDPFYTSPVTAPGAVTSDRYPPPTEAELVTLWKKDRRVVMSVTAGGRTQDFYMPPGRLAYLIRELAEILSENAIIQ
jgi:hypothetical protein